jgi:hypothetical protein
MGICISFLKSRRKILGADNVAKSQVKIGCIIGYTE